DRNPDEQEGQHHHQHDEHRHQAFPSVSSSAPCRCPVNTSQSSRTVSSAAPIGTSTCHVHVGILSSAPPGGGMSSARQAWPVDSTPAQSNSTENPSISTPATRVIAVRIFGGHRW